VKQLVNHRPLAGVVVLAVALAAPPATPAQSAAFEAPGLRAYVRQVLARNAGLRAADARAGAAAERIAPAGTLPDPTVSLGAMSVPVTSFDLDREPMTQVPTIALQQRFPFPGKQGALAGVARAESTLAQASRTVLETALASAAARAYYDLASARTALDIWRGRVTLADQAIAVSRVRYETGAAPQADLLRARLRRAELEEAGDALEAALVAAAARADALRAGADDSIPAPSLVGPGRRAAVSPDQALPADSALRELDTRNPRLREAREEVERGDRRARVAAIAARPDFTLTLQNGVRLGGREPFVSATVGISVPLWASRKQSPAARAARFDADAARERYRNLTARLEGELAAESAELGALATRIRRTENEILPLAEGAAASALAGYRVGGVEFTAVLETQDDVFRAELRLARLVADYGATRARLAALLGEEWYR
jgi:outer membrane protein TolC